jgi:hypothetical protein
VAVAVVVLALAEAAVVGVKQMESKRRRLLMGQNAFHGMLKAHRHQQQCLTANKLIKI